MNIGLFYGSTTGNTERVADMLVDYFQEIVHVDYIDNFSQTDIGKYNLIVFGIPTWNVGELESSWEEFFPSLDEIDFSDQLIAIFGLGDQVTYSYTFQDAMGILYKKLREKGAKMVGFWSAKDYNFDESLALIDNNFVGLALDEDNQPEKTEERIKNWITQLKIEINQPQIEKIT